MRFFKKRRVIDSLKSSVFSMDDGTVAVYVEDVGVVKFDKDGSNNLIIQVPENKQFVFKIGDQVSFTSDQYGPSHATYAE